LWSRRGRAGRAHPGRRPRHDAGQSLVEFAILLPVLLVLTVGIVDAARVFASWVSLTGGVREAALYASIGDNATHWCMEPARAPAGSIACPPGTVGAPVAGIECGFVSGTSGNWCDGPNNIAFRLRLEVEGLDPARIALATPVCENDAQAGVACASDDAAFVTVTATYAMDLATPILGSVLGGTIPMTASATAPIFR
jgi:hypothetical protein